jgi:lysozyme family protein
MSAREARWPLATLALALGGVATGLIDAVTDPDPLKRAGASVAVIVLATVATLAKRTLWP